MRLDQIERLQETRRRLDAQLREYRRMIRNFESDPSVKHTAGKLKDVLDQLDELQRVPAQASADPSEMIVATMREEIHAAEEAAKVAAGPAPRDDARAPAVPGASGGARAEGEADRRHGDQDLAFRMLSETQKTPVEIPDPVSEPTVPIRPGGR